MSVLSNIFRKKCIHSNQVLSPFKLNLLGFFSNFERQWTVLLGIQEFAWGPVAKFSGFRLCALAGRWLEINIRTFRHQDIRTMNPFGWQRVHECADGSSLWTGQDCPSRVVSVLENSRQGGALRYSLKLSFSIRTSMYPLGWQCVHECPRSSFWEPRESQTGRGLRALPSTFAPSSTLSSGHLTSCNDQQILLIIKINQTEDWVESKESLLLWHQPTPAFPSLDSALFLFFSSNAFLWQRREGKENS